MSTIGDGPVPELIPASVVASHAYCARLCHLQWTQARRDTNEALEAGRLAHRRVDVTRAPADLAGLPGGRSATGVTISSSRLGVIARLDVVVAGDGSVIPVEIKRGTEPPGGPWPSERIQVVLGALLLREQGHRCERGVIVYLGSGTRVEVPVTADAEAEALAEVRAARETAAAADAPPPLVESGRCPPCSMVALCMPDEVNAALGRGSGRIRRLVPADPAARPLYVTEPGASVGIRRGRVEIRHDGEVVGSERLIDVSQVCVAGYVQVSTQLVHACADAGVPVVWMTSGGWLRAVATPMVSGWVDLRLRQAEAVMTGDVRAAGAFVAGKIRNARTLLRRNARAEVDGVLAELAELARRAGGAPGLESLLGIEGAAARAYFGAFSTMLAPHPTLAGEPFRFEGRNRRPPTDAVNSLLSFVYSLLVKDLVWAATAVGLDPMMGLYHRPRFGRPALALDLAEEFRPVIGDSVVLRLINQGEIRPGHFLVRAGSVQLTTHGRRVVIGAYERRLSEQARHPVSGHRISYRRILLLQARLLASYLMGEHPAYEPFTTR